MSVFEHSCMFQASVLYGTFLFDRNVFPLFPFPLRFIYTIELSLTLTFVHWVYNTLRGTSPETACFCVVVLITCSLFNRFFPSPVLGWDSKCCNFTRHWMASLTNVYVMKNHNVLKFYSVRLVLFCRNTRFVVIIHNTITWALFLYLTKFQE